MNKVKNVIITGGEGDIAKEINNGLESFNSFEVYNPGRSVLDVTNEASVMSYMQEVFPDVLINCAGYIFPSKISETSLSDWKKHLDINLTGAFLCSKLAININPFVKIINIGSTSAFEGRNTWGAYCCSKAGILALTETLVEEGIEAYSINPSRTDTKMRHNLFPNEDKSSLMSPIEVANVVVDVVRQNTSTSLLHPGDHIIVLKDKVIIQSKRKCPKI